jgi:hypothetical protein
MAIVHNSYVLAANTPLLIATIPAGNPLTNVVVSNANASSVFIGDSSVSTAGTVDRGLRVATLTNQDIWLNAGDTLYAVSAAGTGSSYDVSVLYSNVVS